MDPTTSGSNGTDRRALAVVALFAVLPFAFLVAVVWRYAVDVPFFDHWEFVSFLDRSFDRLRLADFWAQHNEHRLAFPRLVMLGLARWTDWNVNYESAASVVCAVASYGLLLRLAAGTARRTGVPWPALAPWLALLVFSTAQWENWLWGWQLQIPMNVLAVVATVVLLSATELRRTCLVGAIAAGVVASYSFSSGVLCWGVGLVVLWSRAVAPTRGVLAAWIAAAALTLGSYAYAYEAPPYSHALVENLPVLPGFVAHYLGAPVAGFSPALAAVAGFLALAGLGIVVGTWKGEDRAWRGPWIALALYATGNAVLTAIGRANLGFESALASRYVTFSQLAWVAVAALVFFVARGAPVGGRAAPKAARIASLVLLLLVAAGSIAMSAYGTMASAQRHREMLTYRRLLESHRSLGPEDWRVLATIHPDPDQLASDIAVLEARCLSVFRTRPGEPSAASSRGAVRADPDDSARTEIRPSRDRATTAP